MPLQTETLKKSVGPTTSFALQEIFYSVPWRASGVQAGSHKTKRRGTGSDFASFVPLLDHPDPKRLDVRASLKTIPKQLMVRTFYERSAIKVFVVNDLSSSMRFVGKLDKASLLQEIVATIAWSTVRQGDAFGMFSCHDDVLENCLIAPCSRLSVAQESQQCLSTFFSQSELTSHSALAMPLVANKIGFQKSLVFLISDFHWSEELLKQTLQALSGHDVVPIVLWDQAEFDDLPEWGWAKVREMETGLQRSLFMRPALHKSIREYAQSRKNALRQLSQQYCARAPFFVQSYFDAVALTHHLLGA